MAKDSAFLVFRRLRQDVHAFHSFLNNQAKSGWNSMRRGTVNAKCNHANTKLTESFSAV
jgi:hypothetical protein